MEAREVLKGVAEVLASHMLDPAAAQRHTARSIAFAIMDLLPEGKEAFLSACDVDPFKGQFMQPHIEQGEYYEVETSSGTEIVPSDVIDLGMPVTASLTEESREASDAFDTACEKLMPYLEGDATSITRIEHKSGWLARMSAAGYMDCTDWTVHESEDEAFQYLVDNYGDDT